MTRRNDGIGRAAGPAATAIAIVGAACRLPGADDPDAFWQLLADGRDVVTSVPADRFEQAAFLHPRSGEPGKTYTFAAGTIGDVTGFDGAAFGISPREAAEMDPQQRLLLELSREAIEDAGWPVGSIAGSAAGVFVGASLGDYADLRQADVASGDRYYMTGGALSILANRIGNVFDLRGAAQTIDTACSSGLVALHMAATALAAGRLPAAIVGGVNLLLSPLPFVGFARAGMLSPRGRCHAFDASADGYVRAEGGVVLVLKRLDDALADGDSIRAVLLGSGVNGAGRTVGLSLPSGAAQQALVGSVLAEAGVGPDAIAYFEAHGTGTAAGDPIEAGALGEVVGRRRRRPLPIGSLKTNIGHTEAVSGLAGVLKAALALEHGRMPRSLHFDAPNPAIDFAGLGLRVLTATEPLPARDATIGVNSFGFGGTNACALIGPAPPAPRRGPRGAGIAVGNPPLLLSARSAGALKLLAARWRDRLEGATATEVPRLLRGAARHRDLLPHRLVARGDDGSSLAAQLNAFAGGASGTLATGAAPRGDGVAFVFSGNGSQHLGMGRVAMAGSTVFRQAVLAADAALAPLLGWSIAAVLEAGAEARDLAATDRAQPLLFALQHGIVAALADQGIRPSLCLGHSVGEVAAATASGLLDLPTAARLIVTRSAHQHATKGSGRMAALGAAARDALPVLTACGPDLEIAAVNAPHASTVAGPAAALRRLSEAAAARRWSFAELDLDYAFHSAAMDPIRASLLAALRGMVARAPLVTMVSSVTGRPLTEAECDADYWWRNLREPVRFLSAVRTAAMTGPALFLEIGPNAVLQGYLREGLADSRSDATIYRTLSKSDQAGDPFPRIAEQAVIRGADPRSAASFNGRTLVRSLPKTPFERVPAHVVLTTEASPVLQRQQDHRLLGFRRANEPGSWQRTLDTALEPWLADHRVAGQVVLPAAAMLEIAVAAARSSWPDAIAIEVADFAIHHPLVLGDDRSVELDSSLSPDGAFRLRSRPRLVDTTWTTHAAGRLAALPRLPQPSFDSPAEPSVVLGGAALRERAAGIGLQYGPAFAAVTSVVCDRSIGVAVATLDLPAAAPADQLFVLHPSRLDGALQAMIGLLDVGARDDRGFVPIRFDRAVVQVGAAPAVTAIVQLEAVGERSAAARLVLRDADGHAVAVVQGCHLQQVRLRTAAADADPLFRIELQAAPPVPPAPVPPEVSFAAGLAAAAARDTAADARELAALLEGFCAVAAHTALSGPQVVHGPLARALLQHLMALGMAEAKSNGVDLGAAADLPAASAIWQQALLEAPDAAPELAWVAEAAERMLPWSDCRATASAPGPALAPPGAAGWAAMSDALVTAAAGFAVTWPIGRPLRVLQVAAGLGPLSARLAAVLAASGRAVRLTIASHDSRMPPIVAGSVEVVATRWDPDAGLGAESADLIVGLGAAAQLGRGTGLLHHLRNVLSPGGALLLAEPLPGLLWDFCCGQDPGWWQEGGGALPTTATWEQALQAGGWRDVAAMPLTAASWPSLLLAARLDASALAPPILALQRIALFADDPRRPFIVALAAALAERGANVTVRSVLEGHTIAPRNLQNTLILVAVEEPASELPAVLAAIARLAANGEGVAAGFRLITRGGRQPDDGAHSAAAAACFALGRVLANEHPGLRTRRIDLSPTLPTSRAVSLVLPEILTDSDGEAEVIHSATGRFVPRLRRGLPPQPLSGGPAALIQAEPGHLGSLGWRDRPMRPLDHGEVRLRVEAAGMNFRDLMWAQGLLPEDVLRRGFTGPGLGMECAGVVEAVGEGTDLAPGDSVMGIAPQAFATHVVTRGDALVRRPQVLSAEAAATVPVAFLTAVYALEEVARIGPGDRVLVHGGAGGVGLAALQVALAAGARVAATAGSAAKRAFLRHAGAEIVVDSRDPAFADELAAAWAAPDGEGSVDIVLNSLAGDAMERGLGLLRPFGRFLELGKRDFVENHRVGLRPLRRNATFHAIDVDELPRFRPAIAARLLRRVADRLAEGALRPLPATVFEANEVELAFRTLQAAGHIGKVIVRPPAVAPVSHASDPVQDAAAAGCIVVVGGTSGFGLETARWLARQGVSRIALVSRRGGATPGAQAAGRELAALGADVVWQACDAADEASLAATLAAVRVRFGAIGGVVHTAAVLEDGAAASLDARRFARALAAKLSIAEHLDALTRADPVALFLLFSSATVAVGNPGQAAYVAANAALEALARRRRAAGLPALAVGWGPIADAGMLAAPAAAEAVRTLQRRVGAVPMPAATALAALPAMLACGSIEAGMARIAWDEASAALPVLDEATFASVREAAPLPADAADLRAALMQLPDAEALVALRGALAAEIARILRLPAGLVAVDAPLVGLGLDSLGGIELRMALERRLGTAVPLAAVTEALTLETLARRILPTLREAPAPATELLAAHEPEQVDLEAAA